MVQRLTFTAQGPYKASGPGAADLRFLDGLPRFQVDFYFWGLEMNLLSAKSRTAQNVILTGAAFALLLSTSSGSFAQCAATAQAGRVILTNQAQLVTPPGAASAALAGAIGNVNTAFLSQQGSAFVSAPANPAPDQPGGGVWGRAIGGEVNLKSTSNSTSTSTVAGVGVVNTSTTACANATHESFAGVQVGADIARLNWSGWNVHLGTTAGYLGSRSTDNNGFNNTFEVPFFGTYLVATRGRFFADLMVREEFYNATLNNPALTYFNQPIGAHGFSISTSAGYNFDLGNNWFIEPSAGFIYSRTSVDSFTNSGTTLVSIPGTISTNDVISEIGRLSVRAGKTIETPSVIWQPFASASVFHEFAGSVISNYASVPNSSVITNFPVAGGPSTPFALAQQTATSRVGTYGQYSLGVAAQIVNTGWLGFVRVDYRNGDNINGWTGNAGIRYQFTPEMVAAVMPVKVKAPPRPFIAPTVWTGFYVGGFAGAAAGRTDIAFVGAPGQASRPWVFGGLGGFELGYNYQFANSWVAGVEGDVGATNVHGARTAGSLSGLTLTPAFGAPSGSTTTSFSPLFFTAQDRTNWMATATARVGYAWGRTLYYVKGGAAFEDSTVSTACTYGPTAMIPLGPKLCLNQAGALTAGFSTPNTTRVGWTLGYGTEFDLGKNWSAKAEYDYLSFGRHTALATDGTTFLTDKSWISQVKVGVNYRFSAAAVVAKY
jgi:opacity protein-like surface antigen